MNKNLIIPLAVASLCLLAAVARAQTAPPSEVVKQRMKSAVEQASAKKQPGGSPEKLVTDMYVSFSDTVLINSLGLKPMQADLDRMERVKSKKEIAELYGQGNFIYNPLRTDVDIDPSDPTKYIVSISQSGLELEKQEYLGSDEKSVQMREHFVELLSKMVELTAKTDVRARAQKILEFETEIAKVSSQQRNPTRWTRAELIRNAPGIDWDAYLASNGLGDYSGQILVAQPEVIVGVAKAIETTDLQVLKDHLAFSLICTWGWAGVLPQSIYDIQWDFYGKYRQGRPNQPDRWTRTFSFLNRTLPDEMGRLYVAKHFTTADKAAVEKQLPAVLTAVKTKLGENAKNIDGIAIEIGYPTKRANNSKLDIRTDDLYGNAKRAHQRNWQREVDRLNAPVDKAEWWINSHAIAPSFSRGRNLLLVPAGFLQSPVYDPATKEVNVGLVADAIVKALPAEPKKADH